MSNLDEKSMLLDAQFIPAELESVSRWTHGCPAWVMVVVQAGKAKVLASCGRYFDGCDEDLRMLEADGEWWDEPPGVYIVEGAFVAGIDRESGIDEGGWEGTNVRPLTDDEWQTYRETDEPWPSEFYAPVVERPATVAGPVPLDCSVEDEGDLEGRARSCDKVIGMFVVSDEVRPRVWVGNVTEHIDFWSAEYCDGRFQWDLKESERLTPGDIFIACAYGQWSSGSTIYSVDVFIVCTDEPTIDPAEMKMIETCKEIDWT